MDEIKFTCESIEYRDNLMKKISHDITDRAIIIAEKRGRTRIESVDMLDAYSEHLGQFKWLS